MSWSLREEIRTVFDLFAEYGGYQVHHGEGLRIRTFTQSPGDVVGQRVYRSFPTPRPLSDLFAQENLPASFFSHVKYCIGRGSLVKLLHAIRQDLSYHHKPFTFKLTRKEGPDPGPNGSRYIVIEDTEEWNTNPSYGHSIADHLTDPRASDWADWYHYAYHRMDIGKDFSLLLRNEVDSITTSGLEVEIKSYHNCFRRDMEHYALCVLMGTTAGLSLIERKDDEIVSCKLFPRDSLRVYCANDITLLLAAVKNLLLRIDAIMDQEQAESGELSYKTFGSFSFHYRSRM
jgi:hypothetical protein